MKSMWRKAAVIAAALASGPALAQYGSQPGTEGQRPPGDRPTRGDTANQGSGTSSSGTTSSPGTSTSPRPGSTSDTQGTGSSAGTATSTGAAHAGSIAPLKGDLEEKLQEIHAANKAEVQLGELGSRQAQSPEVKQYAEKLSQDHQKNDDQLQQVARSAGANLEGKEFQKKQEDAAKDLAKLQAKQGQEFDRAFMKHMVKDHRKDVKEVENASKEARKQNQTELASYLETTHTALQGHLQEAERIEKSLGGRAQARTGSRPSDMGTGSGGTGSTGSAPGGAASPGGGTGRPGENTGEPSTPGAGGSGGGTGGRTVGGGGTQ